MQTLSSVQTATLSSLSRCRIDAIFLMYCYAIAKTNLNTPYTNQTDLIHISYDN